MGRPKRQYPLGKYRLRAPKDAEKDKTYPVELEYTQNRQVIRKTTNVFVKVADWNQNGNQGRGGIRASHGSEFKRLNTLLLTRVERIDSLLAEYNEKHPNQSEQAQTSIIYQKNIHYDNRQETGHAR